MMFELHLLAGLYHALLAVFEWAANPPLPPAFRRQNALEVSSSMQMKNDAPTNPPGLSLLPDSVEQLNAFFESFFVAKNASIDEADWAKALPTGVEALQMQKLISWLLKFDDFTSLPTNWAWRYPALNGSIEISTIQAGNFCVLHEPVARAPATTFARHWGYCVLASRQHALRPSLHHSAPHFRSDGPVCRQAAIVFEQTRSRSLVVAGATRFAVSGGAKSPCQAENFAADAAHNNRTMFHVWNAALWHATSGRKWKIGVEQERRDSAEVFIQWHGMAETSCEKNVSAFLSAGVHAPHAVYDDSNSSINRLARAIEAASVGELSAASPATAKCRLVATTNVFGRLVNGVRSSEVCGHNAKSKDVRGEFVSVEQKAISRARPHVWAEAVRRAFPANE